MIKYEKHFLVTDEPLIQLTLGLAFEHLGKHSSHPWAKVKSAIAPVEGEAFVEIGFGDVATDGLILYGANDTMTKPDVEKRLNWRVINICQDYGQLRKLLVAIERCG